MAIKLRIFQSLQATKSYADYYTIRDTLNERFCWMGSTVNTKTDSSDWVALEFGTDYTVLDSDKHHFHCFARKCAILDACNRTKNRCLKEEHKK